jgi:hypothetical protein
VNLLVGWWSRDTGQLVDIPGFDHVPDPERWFPASIEISNAELAGILMDMVQRLEAK